MVSARIRRTLLVFVFALAAFPALSGCGKKAPPKAGDVLWRRDTPAGVRISPAVSGDEVFFGEWRIAGQPKSPGIISLLLFRPHFYAVEAKTGKVRWHTEALVAEGAVASAEDVYALAGGILYCFDMQSGRQKWTGRLSGFEPFCETPPLLLANGVIYCTTRSGLDAVSARSGAVLWSFSAGTAAVSQPVISGGTISFIAKDMFLHAVDAATGTEKWRFNVGNHWRLAADKGVVVSFDSSGSVVALDAETGAEKWRWKDKPCLVERLAAANGVVYCATSDRKLCAVDAQKGSEKWTYKMPVPAERDPTIANGVVYVALRHNRLCALDAETGNEKWRADVPELPASNLAVGDGVIVYYGIDKYIYAVKADEQEPR